MKHNNILSTACIIAAALAIGVWPRQVPAQTNTGTIKGHVRLGGTPPGNTLIRMGVDPKCGQLNDRKRVLQQTVVTSADGGLANAFIKLQGTFPKTPVPAQPVVIDQRACIYGPRVLGMRVGQTLEIRNDDPMLHNVHSVTAVNKSFNIGQPVAGLVYKYQPQAEETMLRLGCDVHRWMVAYIGIVNNPYFAVSGNDGAFEIDKVPAGTHSIQVWHERYGPLTKTIVVKAGGTATLDFTYTGAEKPSK